MANPAITSEDSLQLPIDLNELKVLTRNRSAPDEELYPLAQAASRQIEDTLGRTLIQKTWEWKIARFGPSRDPTSDFWFTPVPRGEPRLGGVIEIPRPPLVSISSITYLDSDGDSQTVASADYQVDTAGDERGIGRIAPSRTANTWPTDVSIEDLNPITITFVAGYGANPEDIPYRIRHAIAMLTGHYWENRETTVMGAPLVDVLPGAWDQIADYQIHRF